MNYSISMTSKGQVTIPTALRKRFGFQEGQKFDVRQSGDGVLFVPQAGWDEVFDAAEKIREAIRKNRGGRLVSVEKLKEETDWIKAKELREKYFGRR